MRSVPFCQNAKKRLLRLNHLLWFEFVVATRSWWRRHGDDNNKVEVVVCVCGGEYRIYERRRGLGVRISMRGENNSTLVLI